MKSELNLKISGYQALESIREKQLASLTPEDAMRIIGDLLSVKVDYIPPYRIDTSGLVVLQNYFKKLAHERPTKDCLSR